MPSCPQDLTHAGWGCSGSSSAALRLLPGALPSPPCPDGRIQAPERDSLPRSRLVASRVLSRWSQLLPACPPAQGSCWAYAEHAPAGWGLRTEMPPPSSQAVRVRRRRRKAGVFSSWRAIVAVESEEFLNRTRLSGCACPWDDRPLARVVEEMLPARGPICGAEVGLLTPCAMIFSNLRLSLCVREGQSCSWRSTCNSIRFKTKTKTGDEEPAGMWMHKAQSHTRMFAPCSFRSLANKPKTTL